MRLKLKIVEVELRFELEGWRKGAAGMKKVSCVFFVLLMFTCC